MNRLKATDKSIRKTNSRVKTQDKTLRTKACQYKDHGYQFSAIEDSLSYSQFPKLTKSSNSNMCKCKNGIESALTRQGKTLTL